LEKEMKREGFVLPLFFELVIVLSSVIFVPYLDSVIEKYWFDKGRAFHRS